MYLITKHSSESYHITAKSGLSVGTVDFLILRVFCFASNCENMKTQTHNFFIMVSFRLHLPEKLKQDLKFARFASHVFMQKLIPCI